MLQNFTNGILTIEDGCFKGKILLIGLFIIFAVYFIIRARIQWSLIDRINDRADTEVQIKVRQAERVEKIERQTTQEEKELRDFRRMMKKDKYKHKVG